MTKPDTDTSAGVAAPGAPEPAALSSKTVTLQTPITRSGGPVTSVQLRAPRAGELRGLALAELLQLKYEAVAALLPRITQPTLIRAEIDALDLADFMHLATEAMGFFMSRAEAAQLAQQQPPSPSA